MMQCNPTSLNANDDPTRRKKPFTPSHYEGGAYTISSSSRTVTGEQDPQGDEEMGDSSMFRQTESESEGEYPEEEDGGTEEKPPGHKEKEDEVEHAEPTEAILTC